MTIKQRVIIGSMILGFSIINVTIVFLSYSLHAHGGVLISFLCSVIFVIGRLTGYLEQKWKRDKEFAGIVAERLMRKPETAINSNDQMNSLAGWTQQANITSGNAQIGQALGVLRGKEIIGMGSLFGGGDGSGLGK